MNYSQGWMNAKPFKVGDNVWPGSAIAEIPSLASLRLKGKVEEIERGRMQRGAGCAHRSSTRFPRSRSIGKLDRISPLTEQSFRMAPIAQLPRVRIARTRSTAGCVRHERTHGRHRGPAAGRHQRAVEGRVRARRQAGGAGARRRRLKPVKVEVLARNPDEVAVRGIDAGTQVALVDETWTGEEAKGESEVENASAL